MGPKGKAWYLPLGLDAFLLKNIEYLENTQGPSTSSKGGLNLILN